jgi:hypothetical protein
MHSYRVRLSGIAGNVLADCLSLSYAALTRFSVERASRSFCRRTWAHLMAKGTTQAKRSSR